jgi:NAD(P)-dependent dehydrogenase (short-subunit alcohol dehydrogenase family)
MSPIQQEVEETLGSVDLLANNARLAGPFGPTWETDPDAWWRCLEVHRSSLENQVPTGIPPVLTE